MAEPGPLVGTERGAAGSQAALHRGRPAPAGSSWAAAPDVPQGLPGSYGPTSADWGEVPARPGLPPRPSRLPRAVVGAHVLTLVLAFGLWAYWDRNLWFFGDEWDFLTRRGLHGATFSIWAPHNEHWSTLPILLWRAIFSLEHLSTYWPYLVPLLVAHVVVVHLLWRRCLREGASPWVATALALLFALFGTGAEDLTWAFQIGFVSSVMFGLIALELAEGPRFAECKLWVKSALARDAAVSVVGVAALMCSGVGVATGVALGVVLLGRYGWRRAARTMVVPVAVYVLWFALAGYKGLKATGDTLSVAVFVKIPIFVAANLAHDLGHTAGWPPLGPVVAVGVLAWLVWSSPQLFHEHPAVLGGALASLCFYTMAAVGRDRISETMSPSRYAYIGIALLLPTLALMLSAVPVALERWRARSVAAAGRPGGSGGPGGRRWLVRPLAVVATLGVVVAATGVNAVAGLSFARSRTVFVRGLKDQIVTSAVLLQDAEQMQRAINHYPIWASGFAAGYLTPWMLAHLERVKLLPRPEPSQVTATEVREDESWLDLTAVRRRRYAGRFRFVGTARVVTADRLPGAGKVANFGSLASLRTLGSGASGGSLGGGGAAHSEVWPPGPGTCVVTMAPVPAGGRAAGLPGPRRRGPGRPGPSVLRFDLATGANSGSVWVSLGKAGGRLYVSLARSWGFHGAPGDGMIKGETADVPAGGYLWVNDSVPGDGLDIRVPARRLVKLCELAASPSASGAAGARDA